MSTEDEGEGIAQDEQTRIPVVQAQTTSHSDNRQVVWKHKRNFQNFRMLIWKLVTYYQETDSASCKVCSKAMRKGVLHYDPYVSDSHLLIVHSILGRKLKKNSKNMKIRICNHRLLKAYVIKSHSH